MSALNPKQRVTLSNLNEPQQLRELNRQLEWVWNQLMGGLTQKALSPGLSEAIDSKAEMVGVAPLALFDDFSKAMVQFGKTQNIMAIGATIQFLTELALKEVEAWQDRQNTTQSTTTRG